MNYSEAIGGYFGLDVRNEPFPHQTAQLLNSGRSCFEYILTSCRPTVVYMPTYTCDVVYEPLERLGIEVRFYAINDQLELAEPITPADNELLVYTNYFGVKDAYARHLAERYGQQLILDCSQAFFFAPHENGYTFYSPRKFFGLPDGGCVYGELPLIDNLPVGRSSERSLHLLKRLDLGPEAAYADFKAADESLKGLPVEQMSPLTRSLLGNIDYAAGKRHRVANFAILHQALRSTNQLTLEPRDEIVPLCYPYLTDRTGLRERLIEERIFIPTYWPNVLGKANDSTEHRLASQLVALPIDQRYGEQEMARILEVVNA